MITTLSRLKPDISALRTLRGRWRQHPLERGCVSHWLMNERGGTVAYDLSSRNNNADLVNGPIWRTTRRGAAIEFEGSDDHLHIPNSTEQYAFIQNTNLFSISFWVKLDSPFRQLMMGTTDTGNENGFFVIFETIGGSLGDKAIRIFIARSAGSSNLVVDCRSPDDSIIDAEWHHVVITGGGSGNTLSFYIDGQVKTTTYIANFDQLATGVSSNDLRFAVATASLALPLNGRFDDIRIYNRDLAPREVHTLYADPDVSFREALQRNWQSLNVTPPPVAAQGLNAEPGNFALSGVDTTVGLGMNQASGSSSTVGVDVGAQHGTNQASGSYSITGHPATITSTIEYFVATDGDDANTGLTINDPFLTINKGIETMAAGNVLTIRAGTYDEIISWRAPLTEPPGGTTWENATLIRAATGETVTIQPEVGTADLDFCVIQLKDQSYTIFQDLILDAVNVGGGCRMRENAHHIRFVRGEMRNANANYSGIFHHDSTVHHNELIDVKIYDNGTSLLDHGAYFRSTDCLIDGCEFYGNAGYATQIYTGNTSRTIVRNCDVHNNLRGIVIIGGDDSAAYNNRVYDNTEVGMEIDWGSGDNIQFYNNTVVDNGFTGIEVRTQSGESVTNCVVRNNISWGHGINWGDTGTGTIETNNLFGVDPLFVDEVNKDFHLTMSSPARDAGTTVAIVTTDYDGVARPQGPSYDIGAYEFPVGPSEFDASSGPYNLTGVNAVIVGRLELSAEPGSYPTAGIDAIPGFALNHVSGAYVYTGVTTRSAIEYFVANGTYALAGQAMVSPLGALLAPGSISLGGIDAMLGVPSLLLAMPGTYATSGLAAMLGLSVLSSAGSYALAGIDGTLATGNLMNAAPASLVLSGLAVLPAVGQASISASYLMTGVDTGLVAACIINAETAGHVLSGLALQPAISQPLIPASYGMTGIDTEFMISYILQAISGSYALPGNDAQVIANLLLDAQPGSLSVSGTNVMFLGNYSLMLEAATFSHIGVSAILIESSIVIPPIINMANAVVKVPRLANVKVEH